LLTIPASFRQLAVMWRRGRPYTSFVRSRVGRPFRDGCCPISSHGSTGRGATARQSAACPGLADLTDPDLRVPEASVETGVSTASRKLRRLVALHRSSHAEGALESAATRVCKSAGMGGARLPSNRLMAAATSRSWRGVSAVR
jgi:hypothetical protein